MKKRYWIPAASLLVVATFLHFNLAQGRDVLKEIDSLLPQGFQEIAACTAWKKKAEGYSWSNLADDDRPVHSSREEALTALAFLESYPGIPASHHKAARLFRQNRAVLAKRIDQWSVMGRWAKFEPECDVIFALRHASALLRDIKIFKLSPLEAARVHTAVKSYLRQRKAGNTLLEVMIHTLIFQRLFEESGRPEDSRLAALAKDLMENAEYERQTLTAALAKEATWRFFSISGFEREFKLVDELEPKYISLLERARL